MLWLTVKLPPFESAKIRPSFSTVPAASSVTASPAPASVSWLSAPWPPPPLLVRNTVAMVFCAATSLVRPIVALLPTCIVLSAMVLSVMPRSKPAAAVRVTPVTVTPLRSMVSLLPVTETALSETVPVSMISVVAEFGISTASPEAGVPFGFQSVVSLNRLLPPPIQVNVAIARAPARGGYLVCRCTGCQRNRLSTNGVGGCDACRPLEPDRRSPRRVHARGRRATCAFRSRRTSPAVPPSRAGRGVAAQRGACRRSPTCRSRRRGRIGERSDSGSGANAAVIIDPPPGPLLHEAFAAEVRRAGHTIQDTAGVTIEGNVIGFALRLKPTSVDWQMSVEANVAVTARSDQRTVNHAYATRCDNRSYTTPDADDIARLVSHCVDDLARQFRSDGDIAQVLGAP